MDKQSRKVFVLLKCLVALVLVTGISTTSVATVVYNVNRAVAPGTITGTIVTNGATGVLTSADIIDWNLTVDADGDPTTFGQLLGPLSGNNSSITFLIGSALTATPTALFFDFSSPAFDILQIASGSEVVWQLQASAPIFSDELIREALFPVLIQAFVAHPPIQQQVATAAVATAVDIDIKPGSDPNAVNPRSKGAIPVAVLGSVDFDATLVDFSTIAFGPGEAPPVHDGHVEDVNGDGFVDLILHFNTQETGIQCGDIEATLTGETFGGQPITGSDAINTVGCPAPVSVTYDFTQTFGNIQVSGTLTYSGIIPASITVEDLNTSATWDLSFSTIVPVPGPFPLDPFTLSDSDSSWGAGLLAGTTLQIDVSATELLFDLTTPFMTNAGMDLRSNDPANFSGFGFVQVNQPGFVGTEIFIQAVMDPAVEIFSLPFDANLSFPVVSTGSAP